MGQDKLLGPARLTWEGSDDCSLLTREVLTGPPLPLLPKANQDTYTIGLLGTPRSFLTHPCSCSSLEHPLPSPLITLLPGSGAGSCPATGAGVRAPGSLGL